MNLHETRGLILVVQLGVEVVIEGGGKICSTMMVDQKAGRKTMIQTSTQS